MSSDLSFCCPVCRARQTIRDACRRCAADLRLVARVHQRVAYLASQLQRARSQGEHLRAQSIAAELEQLIPMQKTERPRSQPTWGR